MRQLILLVDALGWLTVERTGFLADLLPERKRLTTIFGFSSTAVPTLLTGALPQEHGHWFLYRRAQGGNAPFREAGWVAKLPGDLGRRWRVRHRLQEYWRRRLGIEGYFSLYNVSMRDLAQLEPVESLDTWGVGSFPGTPSLIDWLDARGDSYHVSDWRVPDADKIAAALAALDVESPQTVVLYLTEVDAMQHQFGSVAPELDHHLEGLAEDIRRVVERMRQDGPIGISLFSDHGMTDITSHRDILVPLHSAGLRRYRDFDGFIDSTVARFWNVKDPQALHAALSEVEWGQVLDEATLKRWGSWFPRGEYGDVFFLANPGVLILPSDMGTTPIAGMHGYNPGDPTSDACFLADRPVELASDHLTAVLPALQRRVDRGE